MQTKGFFKIGLSLVLSIFLGLGFLSFAAAEEIIIGAVMDFSGDSAYFDVPAHEGVKLAIEEINAAGGIGGKYKIKFIAKDFRNLAPDAISATKALLDAGVSIIIGPTSTMMGVTVGKLARDKQIPIIYPLTSPPFVTKEVGPYGFLVTFGDHMQAVALAKYAREIGLKYAYMLPSPDDPYTEFIPKYFAARFQELGGTIVGSTTWSFSQTEFTVEARKIKKARPKADLVMSPAFGPFYAGLLKSMRMAGVKAKYIGVDALDEPSALGLGSVTEGVIFPSPSFAAPGNPMYVLNQKYKKKYGKESTSQYPALGYDAVKLIEAAVIKADSTNGKAIRDAMAQLKDVQGATSKISYAGTKYNIPSRAIAICEMKGGKKTLVKYIILKPDEIPEP
jgi:branched-chain amino acid transport system substrate-binding protein